MNLLRISATYETYNVMPSIFIHDCIYFSGSVKLMVIHIILNCGSSQICAFVYV